jgi:hypothetical protein
MANRGSSPCFVEALRGVAAVVEIATERGSEGSHHGMAITGASRVMIDSLPRCCSPSGSRPRRIRSSPRPVRLASAVA